jgi:hypothetical protein
MDLRTVLLPRHRIKTKSSSAKELRSEDKLRSNKGTILQQKGGGSMFHCRANSTQNTTSVIPSARPLNCSRWRRLEEPSHQPQAAKDRTTLLMRSLLGIAWFMFATVSSTIVSAATIEEVAHCRAIPQLADRLNCFKSLTPGPRSKMKAAAPVKQDVRSFKMKDAARSKAKGPPGKTDELEQERASAVKAEQAASAKKEQAASAKTEQAVPAKVEAEAPAKVEAEAPAKMEAEAPAKTERAAPAKMEQVAPSNTDEVAPANTETTTKSNVGESLLSPTPEDPSTTSSIDRLSVAGQPLCADAEALAAMLLAGLLTSDLKNAATHGCQILPNDAKVKRLERLPSVFPFIRIVRVRVTSPTQPDLTLGFTIETGR